ncbi:MAG: hypothetical protein PHE24_01060 [Patescibacteria group bacterium]|nr:hypothetical protein [Patescibacteria group bacterium]
MAINSLPTNKTSYQDPSFLTKVEDFLNSAAAEDDSKRALVLSRIIAEFLTRKKSELERNPDIYDFYRKALVKAQFIALPLLDNNVVIDLLKNHFVSQFEIDLYNLADKFRTKLIGIPVYEDRDALRREVGKIILASGQLLTGGATPPRTVGEWIKDYSAKLGVGRVDSLKRTQYFLDLGREKKLNEKDQGKLKILFDLYEETKLSSLDPFGYDYDVPVIVQNQYFSYKRGLLEKLGGNENELAKINELLKTGTLTAAVAGEKPATVPGAPSRPPDAAADKRIADLKQTAARYRPGSLERKAVEAEIRKLEVRSKK